MRKAIKLTLAATLIALICGVAVALISPTETLEYATLPVKRGSIEQTVLASGMIQASKLVSVGAQESGQVVSLPVVLGQRVKKGDLIAQIDSLTQQNSLKTAKAELKSLQAQLQAAESQIHLARLEFSRQKKMLANQSSAKADYDTAAANLDVLTSQKNQLNADIARAEVNVNNAEVNLAYTTVTAPLEGTVVYVAVELGQTVNAKQNTPTIVELAELNIMTVKAQISEADIIHVHPGQVVNFSILGDPEFQYHATIKAIEPGPSFMNGNDINMSPDDNEAIYYNALFDIENPSQKLRIGMTAEVAIVLHTAEDVLLVPSQVLRQKPGPGGYSVEVFKGGKIELRDVQVGINNGAESEILSGLREGELLVLGSGATTVGKLRRPGMRPPGGMPF